MSDERPVEDELEPTDGEHAELDGNEELDEDAGLEREPVAARPMGQVRGPEPRAAAAAPVRAVATEDELPYVDDRVSKIWVGAIVAVFALILAYGLLFGKAGALTPPTPSPTPSPSAAPTATASPAPSASQTAAPSITITPAPTVPSASDSGAPTVSPTAAPSST
jgi:hypothetical protein